MDESRKTDERYTTATGSHNLRSDTRDQAPIGDVDVMTAAGWSRSRIGASLLRLASEFDSAARAGHGSRMDAALFVGRLRTLPEVRIQLGVQLAKWGAEKADDAALRIIAWWLHHVCGKCGGGGFDVIPGTGRQSAKRCQACDGTGKMRVPCGDMGKKAANWMDDCIQSARGSIKSRLRHMTGRAG